MKILAKIQIISALILLICTTAFSREPLKVRVTEWASIYYQDKSGEWTGLDVELIKAITEKAGLKIIFEKLPWIRGLKELETGKIHVVLNMNRTKERSLYTNWIGPVRSDVNVCIVVKKDSNPMPINSLDDIVSISEKHGKQFGIQRGVFYSKEFNRRIRSNSGFSKHFAVAGDADLNYRLTLYGRILGFFESPLSIGFLIKNDPKFKDLKILPFRFKNGDEIDEINFGVSKKGVGTNTLKKLQDAFIKCKKDGIIKRVLTDWKKRY